MDKCDIIRAVKSSDSDKNSSVPRIHPSAVVDPAAGIGAGVSVGPYAVIGPDVRVGDGARIGAHVVLDGRTVIGARCRIHPFAVLGQPPQDLTWNGEPTRLEIGEETVIREYASVHAGTAKGGGLTRIGSWAYLMVGTHVGHDCRIGDRVVIANLTSLGGHCEIGDHAVLGAMSGLHQFCRVGEGAMVGAGTFTSQDLPPFATVQGGYRAKVVGVNRIGLRRRGVPRASIAAVVGAYRTLHRGGLALPAALDRVEAEGGTVPEIARLVAFYRSAKRSVAGMREIAEHMKENVDLEG